MASSQKETIEEHGINLKENEGAEELGKDPKIVTLIVGRNRVSVVCPRTTLESKSPVFSAMLADMPWEDENVITLEDIEIDPQVFQIFLEYLSSDELVKAMTCEDAVMILHLTDLYVVKDLRVACKKVIEEKLGLENVVQMYRVACGVKAGQGVEVTGRMILGNLTAVSKQEAFLELEEEYLAQLLRRRKGDDYPCQEGERNILMVLFRWGAGQKGRDGAPEEADKGVLDNFLNLLDWGQMPLVINSKEFASLLMDFNVKAFPVVLFGRTQRDFIFEFLKESSWNPTTSNVDGDEASQLTSAVEDLAISPADRTAELYSRQEQEMTNDLLNFEGLDVNFYYAQDSQDEKERNSSSASVTSCTCSMHSEQLEFYLESVLFENLRLDSVAVKTVGLPAEGATGEGLPWFRVTVEDIYADFRVFAAKAQPSKSGLTIIYHPQENGERVRFQSGRKYRLRLQYSKEDSSSSAISELNPDMKAEDYRDHKPKNCEILFPGGDQFPIVFDDITVEVSCPQGLGQYFISGLKISNV